MPNVVNNSVISVNVKGMCQFTHDIALATAPQGPTVL